MAVIRLSDKSLLVWSPVALTEGLRNGIAALGTVGHLVVPSALHDSFIADWMRAYPQARVYAAPGLRKDIAVDEELGDAPVPAWSGELAHVLVRGNVIATEAVFFHRASRTAIFTDLLQQFPRDWFVGWRALIARWDLMTAPRPSVPRKFRLAFTDRKAARAALETILAWPAENVLMAHGVPVTGNGQAFMRQAFRWLMG